MDINGYHFDIDNDTIKRIMRSSLENITSAALASAVICMLSEIAMKGVLAAHSREITLDGDLPAQILTLGGKDNPGTVYISSHRIRPRIGPSLMFLLAAAAAAAVLSYEKKNEQDKIVV